MPPAILEIFTTSTESPARKTVFAPGESLQWNIIHTTTPDPAIGESFRVHYILERHQNIYAFADDGYFDVIFPVQRIATGDFTYRWRVQANWWWVTSIPRVGPLTLGPTTRRTLLPQLTNAEFDLMFIPGFWRFTAVVEMLEVASGRSFDVLGDWHYRILK
jgi:hypothetical protein